MLNIIPMVVTKKIAKEYTKKKKRERNLNILLQKKLTEKQKTGMQEMRDKKTYRKSYNDRSKSLLISNYFKCK